MKKLLLSLVILHIFIDLNSQVNISEIDLNKYKTTDYDYKSLQLYAAYGGNSKIGIKENHLSKSNSWYNANSLNLNASYSSFHNSRKKQLARKVNISTIPYYKFGKLNNDDKYNLLNIKNGMSYYEDSRIYLKDKFFFHEGFSVTFSQDYLNSTLDINDKHYIDFSVELPIMIGWGRIEIVSNAWRAYRIIQDLNKYNLLEKTAKFKENDIFEIADYITKRNFTRAFDYRNKFKEDMVGLTNTFFKDKANISNPIYYASLYDMWNYSISDIRRTGSAFSIGIQPEFNYTLNKNKNDTHDRLNFNALLVAQYEKYSAIKLNWQLNFVAKLKTGFHNLYRKENGELIKEIKPIVSSSVGIGIGYYPNTRTSFNSSLFISDSFRYDDFKSSLKANYFKYNFQNDLSYYVSSKIRLSAYFKLSNHIDYQGKNEFFNKKNLFATNYGIKYSVYIF